MFMRARNSSEIMNQPSHTDDSFPEQVEVRVLQGRQQSSYSIIDLSTSATLGADWTDTVVLRNAGLDECRISLAAGADGDVRLCVLQGMPLIGGRIRQAGDDIAQPLYAPLQVGTTSIAFGVPGSPAWNTSDAHVQADPLSTSRRPHWWLGMGTCVAALSATVLCYSNVLPPPAHELTSPSPGQQQELVQATLANAGFVNAFVSTDSNGALRISGHLDTLQQREHLQHMLNRQGMAAFQIDAWINESLAEAVCDMLRVNKVAAEVKVTGAGHTVVMTRFADAARLGSLKSAIRRDVPGVGDVAIDNTLPAGQPAPLTRVDDPGKRVAAVVPGEPPYVVTADGTRYFEGAVLPTGQRVAAIRGQEVLLDLAGHSTTLRF